MDQFDAMTIAEFCERHRISKSTFYNLLANRCAPKIMTVGRRKLVTISAAAEWRGKMESASKREV